MEEALWELDRLLRHATALQELLSVADAATPDRDEATDRSGAVRVAIGRDGLPESFRVATDWRQRLDAGSVGAAVAEAHQAAVDRRMAERARILEDQGYLERMRRLDLEAAGGAYPSAPYGSVPSVFQRPAVDVRARPLTLIVEDVLRALDAADSMVAESATAPAAVPQGTGASRTRVVRITLAGAGSMSCDVDRHWAAEQTGPRLTEALNDALDGARQDLAAALRAAAVWAPDTGAVPLDELTAETYSAARREDR